MRSPWFYCGGGKFRLKGLGVSFESELLGYKAFVNTYDLIARLPVTLEQPEAMV